MLSKMRSPEEMEEIIAMAGFIGDYNMQKGNIDERYLPYVMEVAKALYDEGYRKVASPLNADGCSLSKDKIVLVVEKGMITAVYGTARLRKIGIEVLDMDTTEPNELAYFDAQLEATQQHLEKLY